MKTPLIDFFDPGVAYVIENEIGKKPKTPGGFNETPGDRGGATKWGISRVTLSAWRQSVVSVDDVKALTKEEAIDIYRAWFWQVNSCHHMRKPTIAISVFDLGVLFGVTTVAFRAQIAAQAVGCTNLNADGIIGKQSIAALNAIDPRDWVGSFQALMVTRVMDIVRSNPTQLKFKDGWLSRIEKLNTLL